MKIRLYITLLLSALLTSCGNGDEPKRSEESLSNWTVIYTEYLWSDPSWINYQNYTDECSTWKNAHKQYLTNHSKDNILCQEVWTWEVDYQGKTEQEIIDAIKAFVKFTTVHSNSNIPIDNKMRYGADKFEATLVNSDRSRYATYRNKSSLYSGSTSSFRYDITYSELRVISNGTQLPEPALLDDWSHRHQLTHCNETSNSRSRVWKEEANTFSLNDVKTKVEPFVSWSIGNPDLPSYHILSVRIHDYMEDITVTYKSTQNGMN